MSNINIIGLGKMGIQITSLLMTMGFDVNIYSKKFNKDKEKRFLRSIKLFEKIFKTKINSEFKIFEDIKKLPANHTIETLIEDLIIKKKILSELKYNFKNNLLFSNTSSYIPTEINKNAYGMHFFNPVFYLRVIETTCPKLIRQTRAKFLFEKLKKFNFKVFEVKNNRGYVYNYIFFRKIALYYDLVEKYGYEPKEIYDILNQFNPGNNFDEIVELVGKDLTKKIIKNLSESDKNFIKDSKF